MRGIYKVFFFFKVRDKEFNLVECPEIVSLMLKMIEVETEIEQMK